MPFESDATPPDEARESVRKSLHDIVTHEALVKAGPYIGPRGGKWADPEHTIPWQEPDGSGGGEASGEGGDEKPAERSPEVKAGASFAFTPSPKLGMGSDKIPLRVVDVDGDKATIDFRGGESRVHTVPKDSVPFIQSDLQGEVHGPPSGDPTIDAVLGGKAEFLGKGDDGLAFRVGDHVVKVSTVVPYQPENTFAYLTPQRAIERAKEQHENVETLRASGVHGLLPERFVEHGGRGYTIKPYVEIPKKLTPEQVKEAHGIVSAMHDKGWVVGDDVQVGIHDGRAVLFDLGKAHRDDSENATFDNEDRVHALYTQHGIADDYEPKGSAVKVAWQHAQQKARHPSVQLIRGAKEKHTARLRDLADKMKEHHAVDDLDREMIDEDLQRSLDAMEKPVKKSEAAANPCPAIGDDGLRKADGPFVGPRGGKWADPDHTVPWKDPESGGSPDAVPQLSMKFSKPCPQCKGRGKLTVTQPRMFGGEDVHQTVCRRCAGTGADEDAGAKKRARVRVQKSLDAAMAIDGWTPFVDLDVDIAIEPLTKGQTRGGKYIKRVPYVDGKGHRRYRYYYRESASAREVQAGEETKLGEKTAKVLAVDEQGNITLSLDGRKRTVTPKQWSKLLARHYGKEYHAWAERRAQQTIRAVSEHVDPKSLDDLPGSTDAERMQALEQRVPEVYEKLKTAFARSGMTPFAAKRVLSDTMQRSGWQGEARAAAVGAVMERRVRASAYRSTLDAAENLAEGGEVEPKHVATAVELTQSMGSIDQILERAKGEIENLQRVIEKAQSGDDREKAQALAEALSSLALQKLQLITTAFPGLKDKVVDESRAVLAEVPSVAPKREPTRMGSETNVFVAGEGGKPVPLKAQYKLIDASELVASHNPKTFSKNAAYPDDVQERAYHRDTGEQAKVIRNAQKLSGQFVVNTNPDAVNGPPVVTQDGVVLGGNSRSMSMQLAYSDFPEKAAELKQYLADHAHEVGFTSDDVHAIKNPVLVRVVQTDASDKRNMQLLVRQMNESFTQGMDPRTMQVAMGRKLSDSALRTLASDMGDDETLSDYLSGTKSEAFVNALFRDGIIDARNSNQYVTKGTRQLNADGQTLVSRILVGRIVNNADVLSETRPKMIESIARAVPYIVQAKSHGDGFDISKDLNVALDAYNELNRKARNGVIPALDPKMTAKQFDDLDEHFRVLPGMGEPHPIVNDPKAKKLLEVLVRKNGPVQMANVFRAYSQLAAKHPEGQGGLFGDSLSPDEVLSQALKETVAKSEPRRTLRKAAGEVSEGDGAAFVRLLPLTPMEAPSGLVSLPVLPDIAIGTESLEATLDPEEARPNFRPTDGLRHCGNCRFAEHVGVGIACTREADKPPVSTSTVCDAWRGLYFAKSVATTIAEPQPLPDMRYVYGYDVSENRQKEAEQQETRRRAERDYLSRRFGLHGTPPAGEMLRFDSEQWPTVEPGRSPTTKPELRVDQTSESTRRLVGKFGTINTAVTQPRNPRTFWSATGAELYRQSSAPWAAVVQVDYGSASILGVPGGLYVIVDPSTGRMLT